MLILLLFFFKVCFLLCAELGLMFPSFYYSVKEDRDEVEGK